MKAELFLMRALFVATALLLGGMLVALLVPPTAPIHLAATAMAAAPAAALPLACHA